MPVHCRDRAGCEAGTHDRIDQGGAHDPGHSAPPSVTLAFHLDRVTPWLQREVSVGADGIAIESHDRGRIARLRLAASRDQVGWLVVFTLATRCPGQARSQEARDDLHRRHSPQQRPYGRARPLLELVTPHWSDGLDGASWVNPSIAGYGAELT